MSDDQLTVQAGTVLGSRPDHWTLKAVRMPCARCGRTAYTLPWGWFDACEDVAELVAAADPLAPPVCPRCHPAWPILSPRPLVGVEIRFGVSES